MTVQGYWADLPSSAFDELPQGCIAVLPLGAVEQHGPHLPLGVDRDLAYAVVRRVIAALEPEQNVLFLPTLAITKSGEHDDFGGTLSLSAETLLAVLRDIAASVARAGVTRLVFLNAHGGNAAVLEIAGREARMAHDLIVVACSWFGFADYEGVVPPDALPHDIHAGVVETSAMLSDYPDKVDMTKAAHFHPAMRDWETDFPSIGLSGQPGRPAWVAQDVNAQGACGDAASATAEKGAQLLGSAAQNFAVFLAEFARFDPRRLNT